MPFTPWHPERYQGSRRRAPYFEGWYFKEVTADLAESWAFIPGISREAGGRSLAFVQAIEGASGRSWWFEFPAEAFSASTRKLEIRVGPNRFSDEGFELELSGPGGGFSGRVGFQGVTRPPSAPWAPGVMGPYTFVPRMECYHGLVSLRHRLSGALKVSDSDGNPRHVSFEGGRGYAEKDWGRSMPERWIWTQANSFPDPGDSFMASVARIPWMGSSFTGFLCVGHLGGTLVKEASWTGARVEELAIDERRVNLVIAARRGLRMEVEILRARSGSLLAPVRGALSRRIAESVDATLRIRLTRTGVLVFEGEAPKAGLELVGEAELLVTGATLGVARP